MNILKGIRWEVHPGWLVVMPSQKTIPLGVHIVGETGGLASKAPRVVKLFQEAIFQFELALSRSEKSEVFRSQYQYRHEFMFINAMEVDFWLRCLIGGVPDPENKKFRIELSSARAWLRNEIKQRTEGVAEQAKTKLPVLLSWNKLSIDEVADAKEIHLQLTNEGRRTYHVLGDKWRPAGDAFDPDCEEYVFAPPPPGSNKQEEFIVPLPELWREIKIFVNDMGTVEI